MDLLTIAFIVDIWKLFSNHMKQLVTLKAIATGDLVELFLGAFLSQDPNNQRSQRKVSLPRFGSDFSLICANNISFRCVSFCMLLAVQLFPKAHRAKTASRHRHPHRIV